MTSEEEDEQVVAKIQSAWEAIAKDVDFSDLAPKLIAADALSKDEFTHITKDTFSNKERFATYFNKILPLNVSNGRVVVEALRKANFAWIADQILPPAPKPHALGHQPKTRSSPASMPKGKRRRLTDEEETSDEVDACLNVPIEEDVCGTRTNGLLQLEEPKKDLDNNNGCCVVEKTGRCNDRISNDVMTFVSRSPTLLNRWPLLCHHLELDCELPAIRLQMVLNPKDATLPIFHLLKSWQEQQPKEATLGNFVVKLQELKMNDLAANIEDRFIKC